MEVNGGSFSGEISDDEVYLTDQNDEEDYYTSGSTSKLQFRKDISKARWNNEMKMAEVVEKKGKMWTTTGIIRNGKSYCTIEETLFLAEIGALHLLDDSDKCLSLKDMYEKIAEQKNGCSWETFEVYRHLKSLGYIVGRHGIPWTMKMAKDRSVSIIFGPVSPEGCCSEENGVTDIKTKEENSVSDMFNTLHINELKPVFDVYLPNSKFKKSSPGDPSFVLCLTGVNPPSRAEIQALKRQYGGAPLKFFHVEHGRVSFFSFDKAELPVLP